MVQKSKDFCLDFLTVREDCVNSEENINLGFLNFYLFTIFSKTVTDIDVT